MERHRFDPLSAGFGVVFIVLAISRLVDTSVAVPWKLLWPGAVVVIGVALLSSALRGSGRN